MKHCSNSQCDYRLRTEIVPEFRDQVSRCPYCATPLREGPAPDPEVKKESELEEPWITVATYSNSHFAQLARIHLESIGVAAVIVGENTPYSTASEWVWLEVHPENGSEAFEFLECGGIGVLEPQSNDEILWKWRRSMRWPSYFALWFAINYAVIGAVLGAVVIGVENNLLAELEGFGPDELLQSPFDGMEYKASELRAQFSGTGAIILIQMWIVSIIFLTAYLWAKRSPKVGFTIALFLFWILELQSFMQDPFDWFKALPFTLVPFLAFLGGIQRAANAPSEGETDKPVDALTPP